VESAIFLFTRRVLPPFRVNPAKGFKQPDFFGPERLFWSIVGSTLAWDNPEKQERGGSAKEIKTSASFLFEVSCSQRRNCCTVGGSISQSIKGPHKATHGQGEAASQHHHRGQQTLRHEVTQAWGAVNGSQ